VGEDERPHLLVNSIRKFFPEAKIYQCSDFKTAPVENVDFVFRHDGDIENLMTFRLEAFSNLKLGDRAIYLDTDMLVTNFFDLSAFDNYDIVLCKRSFGLNDLINPLFKRKDKLIDLNEYQGKTFGEIYPYLACFTITKSYLFWTECLEILKSLDKKFHFWYGDQEVLRIFPSSDRNTKIGTLEEAKFACLPDFVEINNLPNLIHYKGKQRKNLMIEDAKFLNK
jgi:hypothetical protein